MILQVACFCFSDFANWIGWRMASKKEMDKGPTAIELRRCCIQDISEEL